MTQAVEKTSVEFWNPTYPNEIVRVRDKDTDPAAAKVIQFLGGYFRATEPWQVEAIEKYLGPRAYRSDANVDLECPRCGWVTRSQGAFKQHMDTKHL